MSHQIGKIVKRIKKENSLFEEYEDIEEDEPEWKLFEGVSAVLFAKDNEGF
jgi:hypothetical protein